MIDVVHTTGLGLVHLVSCWPQPRLTVVAKGVFDWVAGSAIRRAEEPPHFLGDEPMDEAPLRLRYATDLAPWKPAADILLVGETIPTGARDKPLLRVGAHLFEANVWARHAFAPLAPNASDRRRYLGTYDERWVENRWPYFPEDFDARYYNAAPRAMQVEGYLKGGERVILSQLTPAGGSLETRLPGLRVRCFLIDPAEQWREVPLHLDTLWLDASASKAALLWRGVTDVSSEEPDEVRAIYLAVEPLEGSSQPVETHQQAYALAKLKSKKGAPGVPFPEAPVAPANDAPPLRDDSEGLAEIKKLLEDARAPSEVMAVVASAKTLEGLTDSLQRLLHRDPAVADAQMDAMKARMKEHFEGLGIDPALVDPPAKEAPEAPEAPAPWTRERVRAAAASGESMAGVDLRERDLSELDLTGAIFSGALLGGARLRGATLDKADLTKASLPRADLTGASLGEAILENADLTSATASGARFVAATLTKASFDDAKLDGAIFDDAHGEGASFRKADLSRASVQKAHFERAFFSDASLDDVNATGAVLLDATLQGARGERTVFFEADLRKARASGACFPGADLREARADGSLWPGADLRRANLFRATFVRSNFARAKLDGATLDGVNGEGANLTRASLEGAFLRAMNLAGACLDSANLDHADARNANLYEAEVWRATTKGLLLDGAHVAMSKLAKRAT